MDDRQLFENGIRRFLEWLDRNGTAGYDPYDLWSTPVGLKTRRLYYRIGKLAAPFVAPMLLMDVAVPALARFATTKKPYATSHSHLILGLLNLHDKGLYVNGPDRVLALADELDQMKSIGYSGDCWGYPFDWQNRRGLWPKGTPLITVTPYAFEAYLGLYEANEDERFLERASSILDFALQDLNNTERSDKTIASSYSPLDNSVVVNASAYRAYVLLRGNKLKQNEAFEKLGNSLIQFVIESQRSDGSWLYALEEKGDDFIDHIHTCFVLKNLVKVHQIHPANDLWQAIEKGFAYYEAELFDQRGLPRPFAGDGGFLKYDLYGFAEAINLGVLLRDRIPRAFDMAVSVARETVNDFQLADGHFVTSIGPAGMKNTLPYIRWPQAQLFHSLTSLVKVLN